MTDRTTRHAGARGLLVAGAVATLSVAPAACGRSGQANRTAARTPAPPSPAPATPPPTRAQHCVSEVTFWAPRTLANDPAAVYGDYQDLGMTAAEYDVLRRVVAGTRRSIPGRSGAATEQAVAAAARAECARIPATNGPAGHYWPGP